ncbi:MAG: toll/interleukin-1 receptor domain-containing protein [Hyphomonadaceae bacterium]
MSTVVIIHAAEDTLPARALAEKLRQARLNVVMEKAPGEELRAAIRTAPVTVALWSPRSTANAQLAEEAKFARGASQVFHALMQSAPPPPQFKNDKSVNLTGWRGEDDFAPWRELAQLVTSAAGVGPLPDLPPRPASGFFQPGRATGASAPPPPPAAPQQRQQQQARAPQRAAAPPSAAPSAAPSARASAEPKAGGGRTMMFAAIGLAVLAIAGGGGYWFMSQQGALSGASWDSVDQSDARALRSFLAGNPGAHREDAEAALTQLEERSFEAASDADTIEALQAFVTEFPDSEHTLAARGRIAELQTAPQAPTEEATPEELPPEEPAPDPDLLPPTTTPAAPSAEGPSEGPAALTPPPAEDPAPAAPEDAPTN